MSFSDAVSQISQIQAQIAAMRTAFTATPAVSASSGGAPVTGSTASTAAGAGTTSFASQLENAMVSSAADPGQTAPTTASTGDTSLIASELAAAGVPGMTGLTATGDLTGVVSAGGGASLTGLGATATTGATLPAGASTMLTSDQQQFASRLASDTGLDTGVVSAWLLAEENGSAATGRQGQDNNDWLNIGYTGSGTYGSSDSVWSNPLTAADATAGWLKGQNTIPGYGTASAGIQGIIATAGQAPAQQIAALQGSGWAGSGYPDLPALYSQVTG